MYWRPTNVQGGATSRRRLSFVDKGVGNSGSPLGSMVAGVTAQRRLEYFTKSMVHLVVLVLLSPLFPSANMRGPKKVGRKEGMARKRGVLVRRSEETLTLYA